MSAGARHLAESANWLAWREEFDEAEPERLPEERPAVQRFSLADRLTDEERAELWLFRQQLPAN